MEKRTVTYRPFPLPMKRTCLQRTTWQATLQGRTQTHNSRVFKEQGPYPICKLRPYTDKRLVSSAMRLTLNAPHRRLTPGPLKGDYYGFPGSRQHGRKVVAWSVWSPGFGVTPFLNSALLEPATNTTTTHKGKWRRQQLLYWSSTSV